MCIVCIDKWAKEWESRFKLVKLVQRKKSENKCCVYLCTRICVRAWRVCRSAVHEKQERGNNNKSRARVVHHHLTRFFRRSVPNEYNMHIAHHSLTALFNESNELFMEFISINLPLLHHLPPPMYNLKCIHCTTYMHQINCVRFPCWLSGRLLA